MNVLFSWCKVYYSLPCEHKTLFSNQVEFDRLMLHEWYCSFVRVERLLWKYGFWSIFFQFSKEPSWKKAESRLYLKEIFTESRRDLKIFTTKRILDHHNSPSKRFRREKEKKGLIYQSGNVNFVIFFFVILPSELRYSMNLKLEQSSGYMIKKSTSPLSFDLCVRPLFRKGFINFSLSTNLSRTKWRDVENHSIVLSRFTLASLL